MSLTIKEEVAFRKYKSLHGAYAVELNEQLNSYIPMSMFEYRKACRDFGFRVYGDQSWGDGFNNGHYDIPHHLIQLWHESRDPRALRLAREFLFLKAHFGIVQGPEWWNERFNLEGLCFYEKGVNQGDSVEPKTSHHWCASFWEYYDIRKEEWALKAAQKTTDALLQDYIYEADGGKQETRLISWPLWNLVYAYRHTFETDPERAAKYEAYAHRIAKILLAGELKEGGTGVFWGKDIYGGQSSWMQPFMWFGYTGIALVEYQMTFEDLEIEALIKRMASACERSMIGGAIELPASGEYHRYTQNYVIRREGDPDGASGELAMLSLPLLKYAESPIWEALERDTVFWRDIGRNVVDVKERGLINFNSPQFAASKPKTWAQMAFSLDTL